MTGLDYIHKDNFRRILSRNISLPLALGAISAAFFVGLVFYLLTGLGRVEQAERMLGTANQVSRLAADMETGLYGYLATQRVIYLQPYQVAKPRMHAALEMLSELGRGKPSQMVRVNRIRAVQSQWEVWAQALIDAPVNPDLLDKLSDASNGKALSDDIRIELLEFIRIEERDMERDNAASRATTLWAVGIYLLFSLGLSGVLALIGRRELMRLSDTYGETLQLQTDNAQRLEEQSWLRTGQRKLVEHTTGQQTLEAVSSAALAFVTRYLDVSVGALYAREDDGLLRRAAAYGLPADSAGQTFEAGDTLIGQAARENRVLQVNDLPDHYLKITSGLGQASPRQILVVPVHNDGQVNGVVELGFLRPIEPRDLEFASMVSNNIGSFIHAALYRRRLQDVLAEAQELNEKLQVQQEELRTTNEELEEQSRVLKEYQVNLENQQAELEQTNEQLSEVALSLDQKNGALNQAQVQLEERATELSRASRYKSEFLANMSHELRTPLNSSLILSKLLADNDKGNLTPEQVKFAQSINSAGNDLLSLINDILDISKVEAGKLELLPESISVHSLVDSLKRTFEPLAGQKSLGLVVTVQPGAPATLTTDRQRVEQILKNLLSNAIKFTEVGEVHLLVSKHAGDQISFSVSDSGIGIRADQQQLIFEAFRQADGTTNRRYGGTGLGLSISRDLTHLLGGSIAVQSTEGKGSTFVLMLPCDWQPSAPAPSAPAPAVPAPKLTASALQQPRAISRRLHAVDDDRHAARGARNARLVLVVEDDVIFAQILYDLAHELNYNCLVAHNALDGLALAIQFVPNAILLDMGLPDRPGLALLQQLKENPQTRHIPVHVVSGDESSASAMELGAIGYAIKPTSRDQLKQVFKKLGDTLPQTVQRVLLVEDDDVQRVSIEQLIGDDGVEITSAATGEEAMALLQTNTFDCMVVDLELPDLQSYALLERMGTDEAGSFPPAIVYTSRQLTREEEADLLKYSRSIIIKGERSPERLLDEVTLFLHKVQTDLTSDRKGLAQVRPDRDRAFEGRKVLLVDDDVRNIFALTSALEQKGMEVVVGRNGFEALEKLDLVPGIDLVLMDIMMPGMDGLEATRRIRKDPRLVNLPIIAVTAKAMKDDQDQCLRAGASDYLAKPIDLDRLFSLLRVWMPSLETV